MAISEKTIEGFRTNPGYELSEDDRDCGFTKVVKFSGVYWAVCEAYGVEHFHPIHNDSPCLQSLHRDYEFPSRWNGDEGVYAPCRTRKEASELLLYGIKQKWSFLNRRRKEVLDRLGIEN